MKCSVLNCKNTHKGKQKSCGFYTFPKDKDIRKNWVMFCRRKDVSKTARICSEHFRPEDFERSLKYEMGFTKFNVLKPGAVPTVMKKDVSPATAAQQKLEALRTQKEMVANMLREACCKVETETFDNTSRTLSVYDFKGENYESDFFNPYIHADCKVEIETLEETSRTLSACDIQEENNQAGFSNPYLQSRIEELEQKIDELKRENFRLVLAAQAREKETFSLQKRLQKVESDSRLFHQKLLTIFTANQLFRLKTGKKTDEWSEEDIKHAYTIYKKSKTAYIMLKEMNFPIPPTRSLQRWAQLS